MRATTREIGAIGKRVTGPEFLRVSGVLDETKFEYLVTSKGRVRDFVVVSRREVGERSRPSRGLPV